MRIELLLHSVRSDLAPVLYCEPLNFTTMHKLNVLAPKIKLSSMNNGWWFCAYCFGTSKKIDQLLMNFSSSN